MTQRDSTALILFALKMMYDENMEIVQRHLRKDETEKAAKFIAIASGIQGASIYVAAALEIAGESKLEDSLTAAGAPPAIIAGAREQLERLRMFSILKAAFDEQNSEEEGAVQ